jgi:type I restriction enzyme S subunit
MSFGKPYIMRTSGCIHDGWLVLSPRREDVDADFFYHLLGSNAVYSEFERRAAGATVKNLNIDLVRGVKIPLPPLPEQRRIAEMLDKADALRAKRRVALAQLDTLTQSIFLDMFGDTRKERTRWPTVALEGIVKETKLGLVRGSQEFGPDFPIPYVRMNAITRSGELELGNVQRTHATEAEIEAYRLEPGDFLFNTRNSEELVGKTALYRGGGLHLFNNNLMRVRFTAKADAVFVAAAFKTAFVQHELNLRKSGTTNVFAIYYKDLRSLPLPLPSIALQREFAQRVAAVEALKTAQRAALAELDALFSSLQHRAFRGDLASARHGQLTA